jgi:hypothetical protein
MITLNVMEQGTSAYMRIACDSLLRKSRVRDQFTKRACEIFASVDGSRIKRVKVSHFVSRCGAARAIGLKLLWCALMLVGLRSPN